MSALPLCVLYTRDADLASRLSAQLNSLVNVQVAVEGPAVESALAESSRGLLLIDLCSDQATTLLARVHARAPAAVILALGVPGSDPFLEAESLGAWSVDDRVMPRPALRQQVTRAIAHARLLEEIRFLRERAEAAGAAVAVPAERLLPPAPPARDVARMLRHVGDLQSVFESIVETVASCAPVTRVGLFATDRANPIFRLRAGRHCLEEAYHWSIGADSGFALWLQRHAHLVARSLLGRVTDPADYALLRETLDRLGAEAILPLYGRRRLIGWILIGHRVTGVPFGEDDLESLMQLAEPVSLALDNALLYEEVALQKTLAETVLHSIPTGIVAIDADGIVRAFNPTAADILGVPPARTLGQPTTTLGSRVADLLMRGLDAGAAPQPVEWIQPGNRKSLSGVTYRLAVDGRCLGAVAIIQDMTYERELKERQEHLDRTTFWTELAAAISHEVRNPLVAISTFAQLLPERYAEAEFRNEFRDLASREIGRLDRMVDQINSFANPPQLTFKRTPVDTLLQAAVDRALKTIDGAGVRIERSIQPGTPPIRGDATALSEGLAHLIVNAVEALKGSPSPTVRLTASRDVQLNGTSAISIRVEDNGPGMPAEVLEKGFSPFCTTKPRGIGLGLPIAQRTVLDHGGRIKMESSARGTRVTAFLPCADESPEENHEADSGG